MELRTKKHLITSAYFPHSLRLPATSRRMWLGGAGMAAICLFYVLLKLFSFHPYSGDEHIYLYQAKLVSEGMVPYADFAMAHPPLQMLFTALLLKLFGYRFLLARALPVVWWLCCGLIAAVLAWRENGPAAALAACMGTLLSYEPLRASSHYTGVNMTVALLIAAILAYRCKWTKSAAALCIAAVMTRLYAAPAILALTVFAIVENRRQGLHLLGWCVGLGTAAFVGVGLWAGFEPFARNVLFYHVQKTAMPDENVAGMWHSVLFHNAPLALLAGISMLSLFMALFRSMAADNRSTGVLSRIKTAVEDSNTALPLLCGWVTIVMLSVLLNMNRIWMYYFIPAFPFAAVAGGWLVSEWAGEIVRYVRARGGKGAQKGRALGSPAWGILFFALFLAGLFQSYRLERHLGYFQKESSKPLAERTHRYTFRPTPLSGTINDMLRSVLWHDERIIGERYGTVSHYLWHESRVLESTEELVRIIEQETTETDEIFGDSSTVPLIALLANRRIAANEVDTNLQRYRSGIADPAALVKAIDRPQTRIILLRQRFGVAALPEIRELVRLCYNGIAVVRRDKGKSYLVFKRKG